MKDRFDALSEYLLDNSFFLEQAVELMERTLVERALRRTDGNQSKASKMLGIHRNTLQRKMVEFQLAGKRIRRKPMAKSSGKPSKRAAS
ncbi:MAG: Fis family transcriptional regulator [Acidobacteriota bacterium]|nr:Fis family transcriptional regulator [Acidobacteriota bacterium]